MPREQFYAGLTLQARLQKFVDYHYDPKQRHISAYEAGMIEEARDRIGETLEIASEKAKQELDEAYGALYQVFTSVLLGDADAAGSLGIESIPMKAVSDARSVLLESGLQVLTENPTAREVSAAVGALLATVTSIDNFQDTFTAFLAGRDLERHLSRSSLELVNQLLYYPTVPAENSWADLAPLLDHIAKAKAKGFEVVVFSGVLLDGHSFVLAFAAGASVIFLRVLNTAASTVASGMTPGLQGLGRRLTGRWELPEDGESGTQ